MRALIAWAFAGAAAAQTTVGVLSIPSAKTPGSDYIPASYVDWAQSSGAIVIPIPSGVRWNTSSSNWRLEPSPVWSAQQYENMFSYVNGLLLPGGNPWAQVGSPAMHQLYDLAVQANARGDRFPVWGTCAGFETLVILAAGGCQANSTDGNIPPKLCNQPISQGFDAKNVSWPLNLSDVARSSRLFGGMAPALLAALETQQLTMNEHGAGVDIATFEATGSLSKEYRALSTNRDRHGRSFVSTMEGVKLPFYGTQWHPEKTMYEWGARGGFPYQSINHTANAIALSRYLADFIAAEARQSKHAFPTYSALLDASIYKYAPTTYNRLHPMFTRTYFFDWANRTGVADTRPIFV